MLTIYPALTGYLADIDTPGFVQEFEAWGECPYAAGLVAIRMALSFLIDPAACETCVAGVGDSALQAPACTPEGR